MDSLRGKFGFSDGTDGGDPWDAPLDESWDDGEDDGTLSYSDAPPSPVGQDERRMQVRAYNYWASLLGERSFPSVEDIEPDNLPDFAPNSVLLDFTGGIENPAIAFLGDRLARECGSDRTIDTLDDVPQRSLLSRITDHYMQILANEAPIGFEAEFSNHQGVTILYRGILLPFSTDDETIDFIYGVINWKEVADQLTTDELLLEIDQALERKPDQSPEEEPAPKASPRPLIAPSITRWADGPGSGADDANERLDEDGPEEEADLPAPSFARLDKHLGGAGLSHYAHGNDHPANDYDAGFDDPAGDDEATFEAGTPFDPLAAIRPPSEPVGLQACLAEARALAQEARNAELRSRSALYRAVSRAYDLSLAAEKDPEEFAALLERENIASVPRAPMTPVVKLVFGADYDKSRIAEYAAVLSFAHREGIADGALAEFLEHADGGLKGVVAQERAARNGEKPNAATSKSARVHRALDKLDGQSLSAIPAEGAQYSLCIIRRDEQGEIAFLGEVADDERLLARAARHLTR